MSDYLKKEDYQEPCCVLNMNRAPERIPTKRIIYTLDSYLNKNDYAGAEQHLLYWLAESDRMGDLDGRLTLLNEMIGLTRKVGKEEECLAAIGQVLPLIARTDMEGSITHGTTLVNAATGYKAFGRAQKAMPLYRQAEEIYAKVLKPGDERIGALYNNMALALGELEEFAEAEEYFGKALKIMEGQKYGELEMAITYLNLADLVSAANEAADEAAEAAIPEGEDPEAWEETVMLAELERAAAASEKIAEYLDKAEALLNTESLPRNGYYAFVCEKCAPGFGYYGYFMTQKELEKRAEEIYAGGGR